jgi:hypothetical protein
MKRLIPIKKLAALLVLAQRLLCLQVKLILSG